MINLKKELLKLIDEHEPKSAEEAFEMLKRAARADPELEEAMRQLWLRRRRDL